MVTPINMGMIHKIRLIMVFQHGSFSSLNQRGAPEATAFLYCHVKK